MGKQAVALYTNPVGTSVSQGGQIVGSFFNKKSNAPAGIVLLAAAHGVNANDPHFHYINGGKLYNDQTQQLFDPQANTWSPADPKLVAHFAGG